mmetsp:Transcript_49394/g.159407  ORF Transcript_49394/g.159407 Transcript_49394/m.159407 type:complete len:220 (-) Transcript_49394:480-1139(-)
MSWVVETNRVLAEVTVQTDAARRLLGFDSRSVHRHETAFRAGVCAIGRHDRELAWLHARAVGRDGELRPQLQEQAINRSQIDLVVAARGHNLQGTGQLVASHILELVLLLGIQIGLTTRHAQVAAREPDRAKRHKPAARCGLLQQGLDRVILPGAAWGGQLAPEEVQLHEQVDECEQNGSSVGHDQRHVSLRQAVARPKDAIQELHRREDDIDPRRIPG